MNLGIHVTNIPYQQGGQGSREEVGFTTFAWPGVPNAAEARGLVISL